MTYHSSWGTIVPDEASRLSLLLADGLIANVGCFDGGSVHRLKPHAYWAMSFFPPSCEPDGCGYG